MNKRKRTAHRWDGGKPEDILADLRWALAQPAPPDPPVYIVSPQQAANLVRIEAWLRGGELPLAGGDNAPVDAKEEQGAT